MNSITGYTDCGEHLTPLPPPPPPPHTHRAAVNAREYAAVERLLEAGVDPTAADDKKRAPIHFASTKGDHSILQLLLDHEVCLCTMGPSTVAVFGLRGTLIAVSSC
jgi:hypothetical protein